MFSKAVYPLVMSRIRNIHGVANSLLRVFFITLFVTGVIQTVLAQEQPPRPVVLTVNNSQYLNFGAFYQGSMGGSVTVSPQGFRSASGDVILLGMGYPFSSGLFDVEANPGTIVSVLKCADVMLTGSNGGTMVLQLGDTDPPSPFIVTAPPPIKTQLRIGGTLIVGSPIANPPGNYSGTFYITVNQE